MKSALDKQHVQALVALLIETGDLRVKLAAARARVHDHGAAIAIELGGDDIVAAALRSENELISIASSILRRLKDAGCPSEVLCQPLNKYEEAYFDMARQNAQAIEDFCAD
jgi:hypothetical protein